jgi:alpha-galactosidase
VDFVKADWCGGEGLDPRAEFARLGAALRASGRPMVFSICEWGETRPWEWAPAAGHLWRTSYDIQDRWEAVLRNADVTGQHAEAAGPGGWNDPDMLEVGNGGMTAEEYRAHFSLWAIMAAPLIAGNDIRTMPDSIREILVNREVIAVDQDSLGVQGWLVAQPRPDLQVWMKPLGDGSRAVALFNRTEAPAEIAVEWPAIGLAPELASVRDLWAHADRGRFSGRYAATVPSHGVVMVRIAGQPAR